MLTMAHVAVVLANVLLWIPRRTRTLHAIVVGVTATSWFVLGPGLGRGVGYCVLTDWHWQVKRALGEQELPGSFITYMFRWIGVDAEAWANGFALTVFVAVFTAALVHVLRMVRRCQRE